MANLGYALFWLFCLCIYLLPAYVGRKKPNGTAIGLLTVFGGWTIVGWIIALVWATSSSSPAPTVSGELLRLKSLLDSGAITQAEFDAQKARLLK